MSAGRGFTAFACCLGALGCTATNPAYDPATVAAADAAPDRPADSRASAPDARPVAGLKGEYFDTLEFTDRRLVRVDPVVDFDWGMASPAPGVIDPIAFSIRWTGQVQARYGEKYTFHTVADDGVHLWVDGQLLIDDWFQHSAEEHTGSITLVAGRKYDIKLEFYENTGIASVRLLWSSPSQTMEVIPSSRLTAAP